MQLWLQHIPGGGVQPYQSGGGVPPEPHGAQGRIEGGIEGEKKEIYGHQERIIETFIGYLQV